MEKLLRNCYEEAAIKGLNALALQKRAESLERILKQEVFESQDYEVFSNYVLGISDDRQEQLLIDFEKAICEDISDFAGEEREKKILIEILLSFYCEEYEDIEILLKVVCGNTVGCTLECKTVYVKMADLLERLRREVRSAAVEEEKLNAVAIEAFKKKITTEKKNAAEAGETFDYSVEDTDTIIKLLDASKKNIDILNRRLTSQKKTIAALQEESDMLWWLMNGWSEICNCPFEELSIARGVLAIPLELYDMSCSELGPVAFDKLLYKSLCSIPGNRDRITLKQVMESCDDDSYSKWISGTGSYPKVQPILEALHCKYECRESDNESAWMGKFVTLCGQTILEQEFTPLEFAKHFCMELELAQFAQEE